MKIPKQTVFSSLQVVLALFGLLVLLIIIRFPLIEGRAVNLEYWSVYTDPFIWHGYATSLNFFIGLYQTIIFIDLISQNKFFSRRAFKSLRSIKRFAFIFSFMVSAAALHIRFNLEQDDDPAGFLVICMIAVSISISIAFLARKYEKIIVKHPDYKTVQQ